MKQLNLKSLKSEIPFFFAHLPRNGQNREMMLLKLNSHLIPGLAEVLKEVAALKANCDAETAASVEAQNATAAEVIFV